MKFIIPILAFLMIVSGLRNSDTNTGGNLDQKELKFIKNNYSWNSKELIIVNFRQPQNNCDYDNYQNLQKSSKWWEKFYSKIDIKDYKNIFIFSDSQKARKIIDYKNKFPDKNNFFLENFFKNEKGCYGVLIISTNGNYEQKNGEYSQADILTMIKNLH